MSSDTYLKKIWNKNKREKDKRIADLEGKMDTMKNEIDWLRSIVAILKATKKNLFISLQ